MKRSNHFIQIIFTLGLVILAGCQASGGGGGSAGGIITPPNPAYTTTISGSTNHIANNADTSIITITVFEGPTPISGVTPSFSVSGSNNFINACSITDVTGTSTCSLRSTKAEVKSIQVVLPNTSSASTVTFISGTASSASTITSAGPVTANGVSVMTVNVSLRDDFGNSVAGVIPTFDATNTGGTNSYGACTSSSASGTSVCTMTSTRAEIKTLRLTSPLIVSGGPAFFFGGPAVAANSAISGTTPHSADGVDASTVTVALFDAFMNPAMGVVPTFSATGSGNSYTTCSQSTIMGVSTCSMRSTAGGVKTLSILTPVIKSGSPVTFNAVVGTPVAANSTITGTSTVVADGTATSTITITLRDSSSVGVSGIVPTFSATDTNNGNTYGVCSATDTSGVSTCTMTSTAAETKTLMITGPITKTDGSVVFIPGAPSPLTSTIIGSGPVIADGVETSTVSIYIRDAFNNVIAGETPTFSATDTGMQNIYGGCSVTDATGLSTCTLASTIAETKTLQLLTPVSTTGGTVIFSSGIAVAANSTITGTTPVIADGVDSSTVTINLRDVNNNPVTGQTPTFSATNTGADNAYGACSATNASGDATCSLRSLTFETKTLSIDSPVVKSGGTVTFVPAGADVANSSITGTGPVVADGVATSTVTITLRDANNNPVTGTTPTFSATDSGTTNSYGACSATDGAGVSTCLLTSTKAEEKILSIATPIVKADGSVTFTPGNPLAANSNISGTSPVVADGSASSTITVTLRDAFNNPVPGSTPTFSATDTATTNFYSACTSSDANGESTCSLTSLKAEIKTLSIVTPVAKADGTVTFIAGAAVAANSNISGTSPVVADGSSTSTISITLLDVNNNPVSGSTPTFNATDTGATNNYGICTATDGTGVSTCTLASAYAETKTLSISTPVVKSDGTVVFTPGSAVAANSTISGTSPVTADGSSTSTIVITLRDISNNPVSGITPTFSATDTGSTNAMGACSATNASGISTCSLTSTKAETKTLAIVSPVAKSDGTVDFIAGPALAANSTITGTGPVVADGTATSTITITLMDAFSNPVTSEIPVFSASDLGSTNTYGLCSATNAFGISTCTLSSLKAQTKTLSITSPVFQSDGTVIFTGGTPVAANSTITGTGPVSADGTSTSTVTILLQDINNNPVEGQTPTFTATDTSSTNVYSACSTTNTSGVSTCTLASATAETKTLSIVSPVSKSDGTVVFTPGSAVAANSTITGTGPVIANNVATSTVTITLRDAGNNPVTGITPTFTATNTGSGNTYNACSATDASGVSTCTFRSTKAEIKTLSIATPIVKADGTVVFTAGNAVAANSTITGTGPILADGTATSTVTINLKDINNNNVSGQTPTFTATNTGSTNIYSACSTSDSSGNSTCTLRSTKAQTKTLSITSPVSKAGGTVTFIAGTPSAVTTTITGTTPVSADGVSTSIISITILDDFSNPISGITPIFNATDTMSENVYGACAASDAGGLSLCTLASTRAEMKTLQLTSPVGVTGDVIEFSSLLPVAANSTITGTGPVLADGSTDSTITITLRDSNNNPVAGIEPTFDATNTGGTNAYDECSMSNASGVSVCTMQSTVAEVKALRITSPVTKTDGNVTFIAGSPAASASTITGSGPVVADDTATSTVTVTLKDFFNNPVSGQTPTFTTTGTGNTQTGCSSSDASGVSTCTVKSTKPEVKTLAIATPVTKTGGTVTFTAGNAVATTSTITGTGPTNPDGISDSTITITLRDVNNNLVSGTTPTFTATGTNNTYGSCSASNASGISTCTLRSTTAETKTLSIATPFVKVDGTVVFATGSPSVANSSIVGTGPVVADGLETSSITITLKDNADAPVIGIVPEFEADGSNNTYSACSATDSLGVSICTMTSTKAESKTVSITVPIVKAGNSVTFEPGPPTVANSSIECDAPTYKADGVDTCNVTVTIMDAFSNAIEGTTPTIDVSGTSNTISACSATDFSGESYCTLTSTKAEGKNLSIVTPVAKTDATEYEFNPEGINIQVPIEMLDRGVASKGGVSVFERSRTYIDPADYVSENNDYYFEIIANNSNTTAAYTIQLANGAGTAIPDSSISVPANTATRRFRVAFTPSAAADTYRIRTPGTAANDQIKVHAARIIITQTKATATKIYIPLLGFTHTGEHRNNSPNNSSASVSTMSTAFVTSVDNFYYWFPRIDSNYDAIPAIGSWTLDVSLSNSNSAGTATAALFDKDNNQQITEATVSHTGNTVAQRRVTFNSDATNFNDGDNLELRIRSSNSSYTTRVFKAGLWIKLKYLKETDIWWRLSTRRSASSSLVIPDARFLYTSSMWTNPTAYFRTFGQTTTTAIQLYDVNTDDTATTGSSISSLTQPATYGMTTSAPLTLNDGNRYIINNQRTSGTAIMGGAFVIINAHD